MNYLLAVIGRSNGLSKSELVRYLGVPLDIKVNRVALRLYNDYVCNGNKKFLDYMDVLKRDVKEAEILCIWAKGKKYNDSFMISFAEEELFV